MRQEDVVYQSRVFYEASKYSTHAEKDAIKKVKNKNILKYCKFFVVKIRDGDIVQATPCDMCNDLLKKYGVQKICNITKFWFFIYNFIFLDKYKTFFNHRSDPIKKRKTPREKVEKYFF